MFLIDTNIHAAYLLQTVEKDALTRKYLAKYEALSLSERVVTDFILAELETFMMRVIPSRYKLSSSDTKKVRGLTLAYIERITQECTIMTPPVEAVRAAQTIFSKHSSTGYLSFCDCLILETAKVYDLTLLTQDMRLSRIAKNQGIPLAT